MVGDKNGAGRRRLRQKGLPIVRHGEWEYNESMENKNMEMENEEEVGSDE